MVLAKETEAERFARVFAYLINDQVRPTPSRINQLMHGYWDKTHRSHSLNGRLAKLYKEAMKQAGFVPQGRFSHWVDTKHREWIK